jgi:two-component system OmpR family response regulator
MAATRPVGHDERVQTPTGHRILVVEDEAAIGQAIAIALGYEGFEVQTVENGRAALQAVETFRPALVLLDVMLPDLDGFEVTRRLRDRGDDVPVVFLTARDATDDKVSGLRLGADDYVTKPFSLDELVERVRAVLRRTTGQDGQNRLRFADLELDPETHEVWRGSEPIQLTATEFRLLHLFMQNPRRVLSKAQILEHVWDYDFNGDANIVETYVSYLRKKIDKVEPPLLHTIRGAGYSLRVPGR